MFPRHFQVNVRQVFGSSLFQTKYWTGDRFYRHHFWAEDWKQANDICWTLGMWNGPTEIRGPSYQTLAWDVSCAPRSLRRYLRKPDSMFLLSRAMHSMSFMCFLGLRSGRLSREDALGDQGLVHGLAHYAQFRPYGAVQGWEIVSATKRLIELTDRTARVVPGYLPKLHRTSEILVNTVAPIGRKA